MVKHISRILTFISPKLYVTPIASTTRTRSFNTKTNDTTNNNINLNQQQKHILKQISASKSVFITGPAGTGKTFLLSQAIDLLQHKYKPSEVSVTASTGIAAFHLNGQTIHSFAGMSNTASHKLTDEARKQMLERIIKNGRVYWRLRKVKALVIDEASMISGHFFDNLEYIVRNVRSDNGSSELWGGIQLIVSADFYQLPPVNAAISDGDGDGHGKEFAFEAECWNDSFDMQVELTEIFRQQFDMQLIYLLHAVRRGQVNEDHVQILQKCCDKQIDGSVPVTHVFPTNDEVRRTNDEKLKNLGGDIRMYKAKDTGDGRWKSQLNSGIAPDVLELCIGARVMLIKNKDCSRGLVNGATGTVIKFVLNEKKTKKKRRQKHKGASDENWLPMVQFDEGPVVVIEPEKWELMVEGVRVARRQQIPLVLAWALSAHKCQGMTIDRLHTDLSRAFGFGMVYVVISRVKTLAGLYLSGFDPSKIKAHPKVVDFYEKLSL